MFRIAGDMDRAGEDLIHALDERLDLGTIVGDGRDQVGEHELADAGALRGLATSPVGMW